MRPTATPARLAHSAALVVAGVIAASILVVLSASLPFYFEDVQFIQRGMDQTWGGLLARTLDPTQIHGFDRPFELIVLKALQATFGWEPAPFRTLKVICLLWIAGLLALVVTRATASPLLGGLCLLWVCLVHPVVQSTIWICDFEVVAQAMSMVALVLWCRVLGSPGLDWRKAARVAAICLLLLISIKTKGTALALAPALFLSALPFGSSNILVAALVSAPLLLSAFLKGAASAPNMATAAGLASQLIPLLGYVTPLPGVALAGYLLVSGGRRAAGLEDAPGGRYPCLRVSAIVLLSLAVSHVAMWTVLPSSETRYLAAVLPPLIGLTCLGLGAVANRARRVGPLIGRSFSVGVASLILLLVVLNVRPNLHFRRYWGSLFIALDQSQDWIEERYQGTAVFYHYWRDMLYVSGTKGLNSYQLWSDGEAWRRTHPQRRLLLSIGRPLPPPFTPLHTVPGRGTGLVEDLLVRLARHDLGVHLMTGEVLASDAPLPFSVYIYRM